MNDRTLKITFNKKGCDWEIILENFSQSPEGDISADNFVLQRANGKHFHTTLVEAEAANSEGKKFLFWQPIIIEHNNGRNKVGDVVLIFRKSPQGRWEIQVEDEDVYIDEDNIEKIIRATRSSLDNTTQSIKRTVIKVGEGYANPRRIGGSKIYQHYVHAGWSPQLEDQMLDVFHYCRTPDSLGQAVFLKALTHMPYKIADEIFHQIREPNFDGGR